MRRVVCVCVAAVGVAAVVVAPASGAAWRPQRLPAAFRAFNGEELGGVACSSKSNCTAVGYYVDGSEDDWVLAMGFNGAKWSIQPAPTPPVAAGGVIESAALACPSRTACMAAGSYDAESSDVLPFAELRDGGRWRLQLLPVPKPGDDVFINGISCASRMACTLVGSSDGGPNSHTRAPLAERWNGKSWSIQRVPRPPAGAELKGVACASRDACTAVGDVKTPGRRSAFERALVESWNGKRWSTEQAPRLSGAGDSELDGVTCPSPTSCIAVGFSDSDTTNIRTGVIERSDGARWSIAARPTPRCPKKVLCPPLSDAFLSISCASRTVCTAVGDAIDRWDGSRWSMQRARTPGGWPFVSASCPTATVCTAVGNLESDSQPFGMTFIQRWTGPHRP